jgi:hypothetical protein
MNGATHAASPLSQRSPAGLQLSRGASGLRNARARANKRQNLQSRRSGPWGRSGSAPRTEGALASAGRIPEGHRCTVPLQSKVARSGSLVCHFGRSAGVARSPRQRAQPGLGPWGAEHFAAPQLRDAARPCRSRSGSGRRCAACARRLLRSFASVLPRCPTRCCVRRRSRASPVSP